MITYIVIAVFVCVMVGVGVYSRKKTATVNEFFLGGRDVGPWLSAFAYGTTYFSAVLFVGYAGKIGYGFGLSSLWIAVGNALVGSLLAWLVLAKRTRLMTSRLGAMTMPSFLGRALRFARPQDRRRAYHLHLPRAVLRVGLHRPRLPVRHRCSASTSPLPSGAWRSSRRCTWCSAATWPWPATTSSRAS